MGEGSRSPAQTHQCQPPSQIFLYMGSVVVKIYGSTHSCGTPRASWSLSLAWEGEMLNAGHKNEISMQEDEGKLCDDRYLGNMPCALQGARTSLSFPPFLFIYFLIYNWDYHSTFCFKTARSHESSTGCLKSGPLPSIFQPVSWACWRSRLDGHWLAFLTVSAPSQLLWAQFQQIQTDHHNPELNVGLAPCAFEILNINQLWRAETDVGVKRTASSIR